MIYLDLDGVFADFIGGISTAIHQYASGQKNISYSKTGPKKLRAYIKKWGTDYVAHTEESLQNKEVKGMLYFAASQKGFFKTLKPLDTELLSVVRDSGIPYCFLTGGIGTHAGKDKVWWVRNVLNDDSVVHVVWGNKFVSTSEHKALNCTGFNDLLIDDTVKNILAWEDAGGRALLWTGDASHLATAKGLIEGLK